MPKDHNLYVRWSEHMRVFRGKRKKLKKVLTGVLAAGFLLAGVLAVAGTIFFATTIKNLPDPNNLITRQVEQSTKIFDRTGEHLLYEFHRTEKRTEVELDEIADYAKWAIIAVEDRDFYTHKGIKIRSFIRAIVSSAFGGSRLGGTSTLTQQLVKNAILTSERSITRKLKEIILSTEIERRFTKDQILKLYFNEIPYGSTSYGIEAASQTFYGKRAKELDLPESALLAAIPRGPTYYSPYGSHREELLDRWRFILDQMSEQGYVTAEEAATAKEVDILGRVQPKREPIEAPHFVFYVREELAERYGERQVETGGLRVITSLDYDKQKIAERAVDDGIPAIEKVGGTNAALVSLDPNTGEILAMVGSRDYFNVEHDGAVNVTVRPRQPGSSFKPIVYLASFMKGFTPETVLYDVPTVFPTTQGPYEPHNYSGRTYGPLTARRALGGSLNIPAVKMIYLVGIDRVLDLADALGYTTLRDRSRFGLSLVLGGGEVKLLEHAAAYGVFATEGVKHPTVSILKVEDAKGTVLEEWKRGEGDRAVDVEMARTITNVISDNDARAWAFGERNLLTLGDRPVAAKTGTTNDFRDGWCMGYTPQLVAGVWTGNNDNTAMVRGADGSRIAAPIWNQFMREALAGAPVVAFTPPEPVTTEKGILNGQTMPEVKVTIDRITGKLATDFTPPSTREERTYREVHDTLHYVDKDDPRGPVPEDPGADPMYAVWEEAVQKWAAEQEIFAATPPTEYDDLHRPEYRPTVGWLSPTESGSLATRAVTLEAHAAAPRGISRVEFAVDGRYLGRANFPPYRLTVTLPGSLERGFHTFTATAFDDIDSSAEAAITVNVAVEAAGATLRWESPANGAALAAFPVPLVVSVQAPDVSGVTFRYRRDGGAVITVGSVAPVAGRAELVWGAKPEPGSYSLWAEAVHGDGTSEPGDAIPVLIQ